MAPTSTRTGPLDDDSRAEHLAQLETTLYTLAGTGLFTQNDARQYFIQIARLVHIKLAAQCICMHNTNDPDSTSSTRDEVQDPAESPEPVNNEPSERATRGIRRPTRKERINSESEALVPKMVIFAKRRRRSKTTASGMRQGAQVRLGRVHM
ncbi:hypothetical protein VM1G_06579 [Cytospora mali]|uniref:Uncharacterized protein n=1 Tax=Cytospora mali TaxID=578113 RepID=A0A194W4J2_CYTMA|nr:hypothetical protein VM1G_06579 [Valsa mali]